MAVVSVKELWDGRGGSDGIERKREYTRRFEVLTDSAADDATVAGGPAARLLGLPGNGALYPLDAFARVVRIRPQQSSDSPTLWYVDVEYSTELPRAQAAESMTFDPATGQSQESATGRDQATRPENPLDRPAAYKFDHEQTTEVVEDDVNGNPILNAADDPYDPPLEDEVSYAVANVTKNLAVVSFDWLENFMDAVNVTAWNGRAARTCRITGLGYEPASENNVNFWRVNFRIKIKKKTWDRRVVNRGFYEKVLVSVGGGGVPATYRKQRIDIPAGSGVYPPEPQLLDSDGSRLAAGLPPIIRRHRVKPEKEYSLLGL